MIKRNLQDLLSRSFKVEYFNGNATLLQEHHLPPYFTFRELFGVNMYIKGGITHDEKGKSQVIVEKGEGIILQTGVWSKGKNLNPGETVSVWHNMRFSLMETIDPLDLLELPLVVDCKIGTEIRKINSELIDVGKKRDKEFLLFILKRNELALRMFLLLLKISKVKANAEDFLNKVERIQPVLLYIQKNLAKRITVEKLASVLSLSPPRFYNVFKKTAGVSPGQYLQKQRMRKAQELLMDDNIKIFEVAEKVGYEDQFHFSRLFKKNFAVSPEIFRQQYL